MSLGYYLNEVAVLRTAYNRDELADVTRYFYRVTYNLQFAFEKESANPAICEHRITYPSLYTIIQSANNTHGP